MARFCEVCGKTTWRGKQVSHSHIRTNRTWSPNIQKVRAIVGNKKVRLYVCTSCLKAGKVQRAV